jgi:signal transduction histidine kinase/CheY-like chemotaxis protein
MFVKWLRTHHGVLSAKEFGVISQLQSLPLTDKSALEKIGGKLYVPIKTRDGGLVGLLVLGEKLSQQSYSDEDGRLLEALSNHLSINLENARLYSDVLREVVERKRAEEERLELERKIQINSRLTSIGEMAAGIAHEINNPLTPILGFADMLLKRDLPEDVKDDLQIIRDSARRTADVTRRLLLFARQSKPMRTLCNINEVVETTLQLRAYHLKTNNIKVITELDPELPQTMADAGQLQQVVLNLIMNAEYSMVHARGGGNLLIKTEKMGNIICLSVKDDGPGISKENMEKLFTPFFSTKKVSEGTGLGLSVCHGIVAEHNGRIYAESKVGKGATFIVELPVVRQEKEEEAKLSEPDTGEAGEVVKARILVVDDEPAITQVLKRVLTDEGYEVEITGKAQAALGLIKGGKYALILLDIKLPDMSGIELYQHLDKTAMSLTQRIIFITGDVLGTDTMDFFSRTGASYVTKPFNMEQLKKEVKSKLTKRG